MMTPQYLAILTAYCSGGVSRAGALEAPGIDWYSDLLCLLRSAGLNVQQPTPEDLAIMDEAVEQVFGGVPTDSPDPPRNAVNPDSARSSP